MLRSFIKKIIDSWIEFECRFVRQEEHNKKRVLILRKDVLGDFIIFIPTLKYYREFYKNYEITLVVSDMSMGLSPTFSFIDKIIIFDQKKFRGNFWYRRDFIKDLARKGFDIAIYPVWSREPIGDLMIKLTRAQEKISFKMNYNHNDYIYNKLIEVQKDLNELDRNMSFVSKVVGKTCYEMFPTIDINLLNNNEANILQGKYKLSNKKYCIVFPGSGASYKIWPLNKFAEMTDYINTQDILPIICGSLSEKKLAEEIIRLATNKNIIDLTGQTDISTLSHIINKSIFYFGSDTGILHLSSALAKPTIAILGGGHFGRFFPYGDRDRNRIVYDPNSNCKFDNWKCADGLKYGESAPCIRNIKVDDAKKEIDILLHYLKLI